MSLTLITLIGFIAGVLGTVTGGFIALPCKVNFRIVSFVLEFSAGLMISVVLFDLIPHSYEIGSFIVVFLGLVSGIFFTMLAQERVKYRNMGIQKNQSRMMATGIVMVISVAIHNLPEGLAIGSGFGLSTSLGISLSIAILVHNIPEGIALSLPLKAGGASKIKIILFSALAGLPMGIGTYLGVLIGGVSPEIISAALSFAGGAMLYVAVGDLIPESKRIYVGRRSGICNVLGILSGVLLTKFL